MKKILLNEAEKKAIILEREQAIVKAFAKTFNKIKKADQSVIKEDYTLQYADRPTPTSPQVKIGWDEDRLLYRFGFKLREDEEIMVSELIEAIQTAYNNIKDEMATQYLPPSEFKKELDLLKKYAAFAKQSKRDNNNVVMIKSDMNHPTTDWKKKEDDMFDNMYDLDEENGDDYEAASRGVEYGIDPYQEQPEMDDNTPNLDDDMKMMSKYISKYVNGPWHLRQEIQNYTTSGYQGLSDEIKQALRNDMDYQTYVAIKHDRDQFRRERGI